MPALSTLMMKEIYLRPRATSKKISLYFPSDGILRIRQTLDDLLMQLYKSISCFVCSHAFSLSMSLSQIVFGTFLNSDDDKLSCDVRDQPPSYSI